MVSAVSAFGPRIDVRPLLARQQTAFLDLLRRLDRDDWARPTACPGWSTADVAAHVLGDHLARLARHRDGYQPLGPRGTESLPAFIDRINDEWVTAARRLSPRLLVEQLSDAGGQIVDFWWSVDMDAFGAAVSWAGPEPAPVWLDAARDFTEYWTHHQQISEAVGDPGLIGPEFLAPVLDTFLRALPYTLRAAAAPEGTVLRFSVTGPSGGAWDCVRTSAGWLPAAGSRSGGERDAPGAPNARVELDADSTWRLCTRGITPEDAASRARTTGDPALTSAALRTVAIIH